MAIFAPFATEPYMTTFHRYCLIWLYHEFGKYVRIGTHVIYSSICPRPHIHMGLYIARVHI